MKRNIVFICTLGMKKLFIWVAQLSTLANRNNPGKDTECFHQHHGIREKWRENWSKPHPADLCPDVTLPLYSFGRLLKSAVLMTWFSSLFHYSIPYITSCWKGHCRWSSVSPFIRHIYSYVCAFIYHYNIH